MISWHDLSSSSSSHIVHFLSGIDDTATKLFLFKCRAGSPIEDEAIALLHSDLLIMFSWQEYWGHLPLSSPAGWLLVYRELYCPSSGFVCNSAGCSGIPVTGVTSHSSAEEPVLLPITQPWN